MSIAPTPYLIALLAAKSPAQISKLLEPLDTESWPTLLRQAKKQRVGSLLYGKLKFYPEIVSQLPQRAKANLQQQHRKAQLDTLAIYNQLTHLLRHLSRANIPVIGLKGVHLAEFIYPNRGLRPMRDIDLLVKSADLEAIDTILQSLGYSLQGDKTRYRERHFHFNYQSTTGGVAVEIHWNIQKARSPFQIDLDQWWLRAETEQIGLVPLTVLAAEDLLIHLSIHLLKHHGQDGFRPLIDIATLINHPQSILDWTRLEHIVQTEQINKPVYLALKLTADLLQIPIPSHVMDKWVDPQLSTETYTWFKQQLQTGRGQHTTAQISPELAQVWRTRNPITKTKLIYQALQRPPDGGLAPSPATQTITTSWLDRLLTYGRRLHKPRHTTPQQEAEIEAMSWLSSR